MTGQGRSVPGPDSGDVRDRGEVRGDGSVDPGVWAPIVRRYLRWYPAGWRDEYGDEFAALLVDTLDDGGWGPRLWIDIVRGGLTARAERFGLIGERGGPARRSMASSVIVVMAAAVFALAVWEGSRFVHHWRLFPVEQSAAQRGLKFVRISPDTSESGPYPVHQQIGAVATVTGRVAWFGVWALAACLAAAVVVTTAGFLRSERPTGRGRWRLPAVSVGGPLVAAGIAEIARHAPLGWLRQGQQRFSHTALSPVAVSLRGLSWPLRLWAHIGAGTLLVVGTFVVLGGVVAMVSRSEVTPRLRRALTGCASAAAAVMGVTAVATLVWGVSLAVAVPDVLLDRTVTHRVPGVPVALTTLDRHALTVGAFGTPLGLTLAVTGLVLIGDLIIAVSAIRRTRGWLEPWVVSAGPGTVRRS